MCTHPNARTNITFFTHNIIIMISVKQECFLDIVLVIRNNIIESQNRDFLNLS